MKLDNKDEPTEDFKMLEKIYDEIYREDGKKICKCCCKYELDKNSIFQVCPICGWESDPIQEDNPNYRGGANYESLNEYKEKYKLKIKEQDRIITKNGRYRNCHGNMV